MDRWVADPRTRVIGICAVGGTGKTALIGHWLKNTSGWQTRPFEGLFAWSFYVNRAVPDFLRALLDWAHTTFDTLPAPKDDGKLPTGAVELLRSHPLMIVLDGMEVIQEDDLQQAPGKFGKFLDLDLHRLLTTHCRRDSASLAVLTSRFTFADLQHHSGIAFHQLDLLGLPSEQGASVLQARGVLGSQPDREEISRLLDGHPLGLQIFAQALDDDARDHPLDALHRGFDFKSLPSGTDLVDKLHRVLEFYRKRLTPAQSRLLQVLSLFLSPATIEALLAVLPGLTPEGERQQPWSPESVAVELGRLEGDDVLRLEPLDDGFGYTCHPILRDHFRGILQGEPGASMRAARLLTGRPSAGKPRSVKDIEPVLVAIDLLLGAGELRAADELYQARLDKGRVFLHLPAPDRGLACAIGFVRDPQAVGRSVVAISERGLSFYLNEVGLFSKNQGEFQQAREFLTRGNNCNRIAGDHENLCAGLWNLSAMQLTLGDLGGANTSALEGLECAHAARNWGQAAYSHTFLAYAHALAGNIDRAASEFVIAREIKRGTDQGDNLEGLSGAWWAELLLRSGHTDRALDLTGANLAFCGHGGWGADAGRCHWLLGWCVLARGPLDHAANELRQAEDVFHRSHMVYELARVHLTSGDLALARGEFLGAIDRAESALELAARGMRLVHADALLLRGKARLHLDRHDDAADDAREALRIATECGYPWAQRDAHALLARNCASATESAKHHKLAEQLAKRLTLTEQDLLDAEARAKAWYKEWNRRKSAEAP